MQMNIVELLGGLFAELSLPEKKQYIYTYSQSEFRVSRILARDVYADACVTVRSNERTLNVGCKTR